VIAEMREEKCAEDKARGQPQLAKAHTKADVAGLPEVKRQYLPPLVFCPATIGPLGALTLTTPHAADRRDQAGAKHFSLRPALKEISSP
jgi:hypothetical protein